MQAKVWDRLGWQAKAKKESLRAAPWKWRQFPPLVNPPLPPLSLRPSRQASHLQRRLLGCRGKLITMNTEADWEAAMEASSKGGVVLFADYTATWCKKCHELKPKIEELAAKHNDALFVLLDVDELEDVAYENGAAALPMTEVYQNGTKLDQVVGAHPEKLEPMLLKAKKKAD